MSIAGLYHDYERANRKWTAAEFRAVYDATPPSLATPYKDAQGHLRKGKGEAAGLFWQSMAIASGRTWWGVYRYALRHGYKAKIAEAQ